MKPKNFEETKKQLISLRHNKNETNMQNFRKLLSPSSRFLDNYFNPNAGMHTKSWKPIGKVIEKKYLLFKY